MPNLTVKSLRIETVHVADLHTRFGAATPIDYPAESLHRPLTQWSMEIDDAPIFRFIYRCLSPRRHLEFGTWLGVGALLCLQESGATVWTINLPDGEKNDQGESVYHGDVKPDDLPTAYADAILASRRGGAPTDAVGVIGARYRNAGLGHRVCQIYCDSRNWDSSAYPQHFFDTVLIDGGHQEDVVASDTARAIPLLRPGGVIMWHDYCPDPQVQATCDWTNCIARAIERSAPLLEKTLESLFWINPSWILAGVRR